MSLGLARRKELQKRRNQRFWLLFRIIFFLSVVIASSYFAFDTGQEIALRSSIYNKDKFDLQTAELEKMRRDLGDSKAALTRLQQLLPTSDIQNLMVEINRKAAEGITPERMATLITGLSADAQCSDQSESKRFVISTPVSQQQESTVSFYRGLITISGKGSPTLNEEGNPEAWYDPLKPVTVTFTLPGGEKQKTTGMLPLYHSIIIKDGEYRFAVISGQRSFADITVRSCKL